MLRDDRNLSIARSKLENLKKDAVSLASKYSGSELQAYLSPVVDDISEIEHEIQSYERIKNGTLIDTIRDLQEHPVSISRVGEVLTKLRLATKKSQDQLALKLNWKQPNVSRFENENNSSQTIKNVVEYAGALGINLHVIPYLPLHTGFITEVVPPVSKFVVGFVKASDEQPSDYRFTSPIEDTTIGAKANVFNESEVEIA